MVTAKKKGCGYTRKIHATIRQLGLDEEAYRAVYERVTGLRSLSAMSVQQRRQVADELTGDGQAKSDAPLRTNDAPRCQSPQARLIRHQWLRLKNMGVLRNSSETALLAYVERLTGVKRMEWLKPVQAAHVIETIKCWVARVEAEQLLKASGGQGHGRQ